MIQGITLVSGRPCNDSGRIFCGHAFEQLKQQPVNVNGRLLLLIVPRNNDYKFAFADNRTVFDSSAKRTECRLNTLLMEFREFATDEGTTRFTEYRSKILQGRADSMHRFEEDQRTWFAGQFIQGAKTRRFFCRQETFEAESVCRQTGGGQRSYYGARTRNWRHDNAMLVSRLNETIAGIADQWRPGVADEGDGISANKLLNNFGGNLFLVVVVQRHLSCFDA